MHRSLQTRSWVLLLALFANIAHGHAQDSLSVNAARQDLEERIKRLSARVEELEAMNDLFRRRLAKQEEELRKLQGDVARANNQSSLQESVRRLGKTIEEVDRKRLEDNDKIRNEIANLGKILAERPTVPSAPIESPRPSQPIPRGSGAGSTERGVEYQVMRGDTLSGIVAKFRQQGVKVTMAQIREANPGMNLDRVLAGQKLFVPIDGTP